MQKKKECDLGIQTRIAMQVKLLQLQRDGLERLTLNQLVDTINGLRWRSGKPSSINACVNDIFSTKKEEVVIYLSKKAIIDGYSSKLSDFEDLLGGN